MKTAEWTERTVGRCLVERKRKDYEQILDGHLLVRYGQEHSGAKNLLDIGGVAKAVVKGESPGAGHIVAIIHKDGTLEPVWEIIDSSD